MGYKLLTITMNIYLKS